MNGAGLLAFAGTLGAAVAGIHMWLRPQAYIGRGNPPATDPRTVRAFGAFFTVIGIASFLLSLIKFVSE